MGRGGAALGWLRERLVCSPQCLVAGTVLELEEADGLQLRPLAKNLVCSLQLVRKVLREQSLSQASPCSEPVRMALIRFDTLFAEFELRYVPGAELSLAAEARCKHWGRAGQQPPPPPRPFPSSPESARLGVAGAECR